MTGRNHNVHADLYDTDCTGFTWQPHRAASSRLMQPSPVARDGIAGYNPAIPVSFAETHARYASVLD